MGRIHYEETSYDNRDLVRDIKDSNQMKARISYIVSQMLMNKSDFLQLFDGGFGTFDHDPSQGRALILYVMAQTVPQNPGLLAALRSEHFQSDMTLRDSANFLVACYRQ